MSDHAVNCDTPTCNTWLFEIENSMAASIRRRCGGIQVYITYIQRMNPMRGYRISDAIGLAFTVRKFSLVLILLLGDDYHY